MAPERRNNNRNAGRNNDRRNERIEAATAHIAEMDARFGKEIERSIAELKV